MFPTYLERVIIIPTALPPKVRAIIYYVYLAAGLIVGCLQVYLLATDQVNPVWFKGVTAVVAFLGAGFGFTAASHVVTSPPPVDAAQPEAGGTRTIG